jgi:GAF domain-containing protein
MWGDRVGYRVQRGLSAEAANLGGLRREMTFCTHCVSSQAPLVVNNSLAEPFFRGNPAVSRHRIRAYVGVPLRTSRGIIIGTLCALDYRPRAIPQEFVRVLEIFARRVVAEIERPRGLSMLSDLVVDPPRGFILRRPFFEELLSIELARLRSEGRSTSLLIASGCPRDRQGAIAGLLRDDEVAGELTDDTFGVLLSKSSLEDAKVRCAALTSALKGEGEGAELARSAPLDVAFTPFTPDGAIVDAAGWIEAARAASLAPM